LIDPFNGSRQVKIGYRTLPHCSLRGFKVAEIPVEVIPPEFIGGRVVIQSRKIVGLFGPGEAYLWITREVTANRSSPATRCANDKKIGKL
jgi:hypothetical protein